MTASQRLLTYLQRLLRFSAVMVALIAVMAGSLALVGPQIHNLVSAHRSDHEQINLKPLAERSYIYDSVGNEQGVLTNRNNPQNRAKVTLDQIPETVKGSVIATEDANFSEHNGINLRSIGRAVNANLESGEVSQGGSTITQQVVKNSLVGDDQDLSRKMREAFLAIELEKQMSKDDILEYYLNSVYFGGGAYGVQAASEYYFAKDVGDLNWSEGALLASLIRSPNEYNPFRNPDTAKKRRDLVFKRLQATKRLTAQEILLWGAVELPTEPNPTTKVDDYFVEEVKQRLLADPKFGLGANEAARNRAVFEGGIRVYTTFDPVKQFVAVAARNDTLPANQGDGTFDAGINPANGEPLFGTEAIASVEPSTGAVRVMVGGAGFDRYPFNLVTQSEQAPGSTMKTFVMATLFEQGKVPEDTVGGGCTFENDPITYKGPSGTIKYLTQKSSNCGYMKLGRVAGITNVAELANRVGIRTSTLYDEDRQGNPTAPPNNLPLGTKEVTPLELASAYATFANDGRYNEPYLIERIEDRDGKVLYQHENKPVQVVSEQTARLVTEVLVSNVEAGTGRNAQIDGGQVAAGKTGTTNESADVWFAGYTPQLATAIWLGVVGPNLSLARANRELAGATGGRFPAATWGRLYSALYGGEPNVPFAAPEPTRRGESVGKVPDLLGGGSSRGGRTRTRSRTRNRNQPTAPADAPPPAPAAPAPAPAEEPPPPAMGPAPGTGTEGGG